VVVATTVLVAALGGFAQGPYLPRQSLWLLPLAAEAVSKTMGVRRTSAALNRQAAGVVLLVVVPLFLAHRQEALAGEADRQADSPLVLLETLLRHHRRRETAAATALARVGTTVLVVVAVRRQQVVVADQTAGLAAAALPATFLALAFRMPVVAVVPLEAPALPEQEARAAAETVPNTAARLSLWQAPLVPQTQAAVEEVE